MGFLWSLQFEYSAFVFLVTLAVAILFSLWAKAISASGAVAGGGIAIGLYLGSGWLGVVLLGLFFVAGSGATKWERARKASLGVAQEAGGQRTWVNAVSNGGVAAALSLLGWGSGWEVPLVYPMMTAAIASATSDTLSSELGNLYGRRYWNIMTWQSGVRGADGVISWEGTLFGVAGTVLIALPVGWWTESWKMAIVVALAGMIGNWSDSLLGATLQNRGWLNNHSVNFWSTLIAAIAASLLYGR
ncbi:MAG: DUF92 domain-containing protein [Phaeodactylibacter sp.]|uniref:DUF92 domain-containing protein n=1 Tax=Phaeodactylibacter sp. TaxID=1940289 RepID=UPI0032EC9DD1